MIRQVITGLIFLGICGYAAFLLVTDFGRVEAGRGNRIGQSLYDGLDVAAVTGIRITRATGSLTLRKDGLVWRVESKLGYPADSLKIKELFDVLSRLKVLNSHEMSAEDFAALDLENPVESPESKGCLLEFLNANDRVAAALVVGKEHRAPDDEQVTDGRFVRIPGESMGCIVPYLFPEADVDGSLWLDSSFPACKLTRRITLREGDKTIWAFERETRTAPMMMADMPDGATLDADVVSRLENAVGFARFSSVATPEQKSGIAFDGRVFEYETFEGFIYTWSLGTALVDDRLLPVKVGVSLAKGAKSTKTMNDRLAREQAHYRGWVYLLSRSTFAPLQLDAGAFARRAK